MNPLALEYVEAAEMDYRVAPREFVSRDDVYNLVCFHAQQCVEKYLKAFLTESGVAFPRTHDLVELLALASQRLSELMPLADEMDILSRYAVQVRYPGRRLKQQEAARAVGSMGRIRLALRRRLGFDG